MSNHEQSKPILPIGKDQYLDSSGKVHKLNGINKAFASAQQKTADLGASIHRRYIDDLPLPAQQSKPVAVICAYMLFGLVPADIASVLRVSYDDVIAVIDSPAYESFLDNMLQNIREHDKNAVRRKLNAEAENAVDVIALLSREGKKETTRLSAAKDILDRTGHRVQEKTTRESDVHGITVRILDDREEKTSLEINLMEGHDDA